MGRISDPGSLVPSACPRTSMSHARRLPQCVCQGTPLRCLHPGSRGSARSRVLSTADEAHLREPERGMQGRQEGEGTLRVGRPASRLLPELHTHSSRLTSLRSLAYGPTTSSPRHPHGDGWPMWVASATPPLRVTGVSTLLALSCNKFTSPSSTETVPTELLKRPRAHLTSPSLCIDRAAPLLWARSWNEGP